MPSESIINHTAVFVLHLVIIVTNVVSLLFSISWVIYLWLKLKKIWKQLERVDVFNVIEIKEMRSKVNKYYLYLAVMVIEAIHVALRLVIYIVFTVFDILPYKPTCSSIEDYSAYYFIERLQPYQFIWIGLSHSFALALIISLIVTMLYLRETYSYYKRRFKWIKRWVVIGIVQFFAVWVFLSIPYIAPIGSLIFTLSAILDFLFLVKAAKRLLAILNMRLFDLKYEPEKYYTFRRSMVKFQWLGVFLLSLMLYMVGIVFAHIAIWLSVSPCFFSTYYNIPSPILNATQVETIFKVASIVWLLDYIAIFQFDIVLLVGNVIYMIYTRFSRRNINDETRQLMNDYSNSLANHRPRVYTL